MGLLLRRSLLLVFCLCSVGNVYCLIREKSVSVWDFKELEEFEEFGFDQGGSIEISSAKLLHSGLPVSVPDILTDRGDLFVIGCTSNEVRKLNSEEVGCPSMFARVICQMWINITSLLLPYQSHEIEPDSYPSAINFNHPSIITWVGERNEYTFMAGFSTCPPSTGFREPYPEKQSLEVLIEYTFMNPEGHHLGLGEIHLPSIFFGLTIAWAVLVVIWMTLPLFFKNFLGKIHFLVFLVIFLKFFGDAIAFLYWKICSETGSCIEQLRYLQHFFFAISETLFFCLLLFISKGWKITHSVFPTNEIRTDVVALVLLLSTLLFFSFYDAGYYFLSLMIMYFFMLPKIFTSIAKNTRALYTQRMVVMQLDIDHLAPLSAKSRFFQYLRITVILYLGSILVVSSLRIVMVWYFEWLNELLEGTVVFGSVTVVAFLLLPHRSGLFSSPLDGNALLLRQMQEMLDELSAPRDIDISDVLIVQYPSESVKKDTQQTAEQNSSKEEREDDKDLPFFAPGRTDSCEDIPIPKLDLNPLKEDLSVPMAVAFRQNSNSRSESSD